LPESGGSNRSAPTFSQELESVPGLRRRLGWLVIAAAIVLGTSVLLVLFFYSLYMSNPPAMQATCIEALSRKAALQLDPDAKDRAAELHDAFRALSAANGEGNLAWHQLWALGRIYLESGADGTIDSEEVDTLIEGIREAVLEASSPRRL
jgi:hypothetical protein